MKFVFFGTSEFATQILETLLENNFTPSLIVTTPDKPKGRGLKLTPPPVKEWAEENKIPIAQPEKLKSEDFHQKLKDENYDLFIVASYGKIIPKSVLDIPKHKTINVHPSLLPRWRGADPIRSSILAGDKETGVSIMLLDEEMDHGPILAVEKFRLSNDITYEELEKTLSKLGGELLVKVMPEWAADKIGLKEQDHAKATYTKKVSKEDGRIDWNESAEVIRRKIRALNPWPGTFTFWKNKDSNIRIKILEGEIISPPPNINTGKVFKTKNGFAIKCGKEAIEIYKLQIEGKKPMDASAFTNGYPRVLGACLS